MANNPLPFRARPYHNSECPVETLGFSQIGQAALTDANFSDPNHTSMPATSEAISHWHHSVEGLSTSSLDFYTALDEALKAKEAPVRTERVELGESGMLSAKRTYFRISYERFVFDIGASPFGKDFFFSWWLGRRLPDIGAMVGCLVLLGLPVVLLICLRFAGLIGGIVLFAVLLAAMFFLAQQGGSAGTVNFEDVMLAVPGLGPLYQRFFKPVTYYSEDTRMMFEETVHRVVLDVVAGILTVNNLRPLSAEENSLKEHKVKP